VDKKIFMILYFYINISFPSGNLHSYSRLVVILEIL
jgi:hypothetical protein